MRVCIAAGELNRRVTIESPPTALNGSGEVDYDAAWTTVGTRWAKVEPSRGREYTQGDGQQANADTLITVRYDSTTKTITEAMRVTLDGAVYNIAAPPIDVANAHVVIELPCLMEGTA